MSPAWRIVPFNLEESFHWTASHLHLLFHWPIHDCQGIPVSEISLAYMPCLCPQALQQTFVVQTHNADNNPTMWEHPTTPFHRTKWGCGPTPFKEHSAGGAPRGGMWRSVVATSSGSSTPASGQYQIPVRHNFQRAILSLMANVPVTGQVPIPPAAACGSGGTRGLWPPGDRPGRVFPPLPVPQPWPASYHRLRRTSGVDADAGERLHGCVAGGRPVPVGPQGGGAGRLPARPPPPPVGGGGGCAAAAADPRRAPLRCRPWTAVQSTGCCLEPDGASRSHDERLPRRPLWPAAFISSRRRVGAATRNKYPPSQAACMWLVIPLHPVLPGARHGR